MVSTEASWWNILNWRYTQQLCSCVYLKLPPFKFQTDADSTASYQNYLIHLDTFNHNTFVLEYWNLSRIQPYELRK